MSKPNVRKLLATLMVGAVVVPFVGYSVRGSMPFIHDPWGMAAVNVVGALLTFAVLGRTAFGVGRLSWVMATLGMVTVGFATAALIAETSWTLLVPAVSGLVVTWALAVARQPSIQ